jgi:hypothetical protein
MKIKGENIDRKNEEKGEQVISCATDAKNYR